MALRRKVSRSRRHDLSGYRHGHLVASWCSRPGRERRLTAAENAPGGAPDLFDLGKLLRRRSRAGVGGRSRHQAGVVRKGMIADVDEVRAVIAPHERAILAKADIVVAECDIRHGMLVGSGIDRVAAPEQYVGIDRDVSDRTEMG